jgi:hypothetical protein
MQVGVTLGPTIKQIILVSIVVTPNSSTIKIDSGMVTTYGLIVVTPDSSTIKIDSCMVTAFGLIVISSALVSTGR